jgi:PAT family beta-lactamase induction signal transducer AmpG
MPDSLLNVVRRRFWVVTTYFAEGFPYSVVRQISSVFFKDNGASLQAIGLTSLYGLPWVLKFLWAPFIDAFATKRRWLLVMEVALVAAMLAMVAGSATPWALAVVAGLFLLTAALSATHDSSVDGYYLEALNKQEQARYVGFQAMSYRIALVAGGGGVIWFSGRAGWGPAFGLCAVVMGLVALLHLLFLPRVETPRRPAREMLRFLGRPRAWLAVAASLIGSLAVRYLYLTGIFQPVTAAAGPTLERIGLPGFITLTLLLALAVLATQVKRIDRRLRASDSFYARAFVDYLAQPRVGWILTFVVLYRTGESFLLNMAYPFFSDIGLSRADYGVAYGTFGVSASIAGGLLGGFLISKFGLRRMIWPLALAQNMPNFLYMAMAFLFRDAALRRAGFAVALAAAPAAGPVGGPLGAPLTSLLAGLDMLARPLSWAADLRVVTPLVVLEALGAGLGTAAFMVFIQRTTKPAFKAAHFAIATSIMSVAATLSGVFSGWLAAWLGWPMFFGFTFLATVPGMLCILRLPYLDGSSASDPPKSQE